MSSPGAPMELETDLECSIVEEAIFISFEYGISSFYDIYYDDLLYLYLLFLYSWFLSIVVHRQKSPWMRWVAI